MTKIKSVTVSEFIDTKMKLFSGHSNIRGIPFIGDGFKEAQRKAIYGMLVRGENSDKDTVERIASFCASATDYKHGVNSLEGTIVKIAQNYAGSNNVPILEAHGQFGNRLSNEASASRYIKTKFHKNFRDIFKKEDDKILEHKTSDGMKVEPKHFLPILPMVLLNGAEGMGTGHSTFILCYNPKDIQNLISKILSKKPFQKNSIFPWWNGFKGGIKRVENTYCSYEIIGEFEKHITGRSNFITITELPIGYQNESYKKHLKKLQESGDILDFDNLSGEIEGFKFVCKVPIDTYQKSDEEIQKLFKLVSKETENLTVWNSEGKLQRFECIEDLLIDFVNWRLPFFEKRRLFQIDNLNKDIQLLNEKIRFIQYYIKNVNVFKNTSKKELVELLISEKFTEYDKLLSMPIWNLTKDKMEELKNEVLDLESKLSVLEKDTKEQMFSRELNQLKF